MQKDVPRADPRLLLINLRKLLGLTGEAHTQGPDASMHGDEESDYFISFIVGGNSGDDPV
jgi:hypothetical protein